MYRLQKIVVFVKSNICVKINEARARVCVFAFACTGECAIYPHMCVPVCLMDPQYHYMATAPIKKDIYSSITRVYNLDRS